MPQSPAFELSSIGIAKEPAFATLTGPAIWLSAQDVDFHGTTEVLARGSARGTISQELGATGNFTGSGSTTVELDPDIAGTIIGLAMGAEVVTENLNNPGAPAAVSTTSATAVAFLGSQTITPAAMTNITVGMLLRFGATTANQEDVVVLSLVSTTGFVCTPRRTHAAGFAIIQTPLALAYDHLFTLGSPRATSTVQWNRKQDCLAYIGNKISSLQISAANKQILLAKLATVYSTEQTVSVPGTPSFSEINPFRFEDAGNLGFINGQARTDVISWDLTLNLGLIGSEQTFGHGRFISSSPEGQSKVTGTMMLQFQDETIQQYFWGALNATSPQSTVQPLSLSFFWNGQDYVNAAVRYGITFLMPAVLITEDATPGRTGGLIQQSVKFEAFESVPGAADDVSVLLTNANASAF